MSDQSWREELSPNVLTLQIIVGALIAGSLAFLVVALLLRLDGAEDTSALLVSYTALAFAGGVVVAQAVATTVIVSNGRRQIAQGTWRPPGGSLNVPIAELLERTGDAGKLMMVLQIRTIVSAAMFEGAAFFALIAYMMESYPWCLVVAVALILGVAWNMPTHQRVVGWIESQLQLIEQERQFQ